MTAHELNKVADEEIERLLDCELRDEIYQRPTLVIDPELQQKYLQAEENFIAFEKQIKAVQKVRDDLRAEMLRLFEEQGIKSWESPDGKLLVTYIPQTEQVRVDSTKLKTKFPQVFTECQKLSKVKSQIRVTVRGEDDGE